MKSLLPIALCLLAYTLSAQERKPAPLPQSVSIHLHAPLGNFSETHFAGIGAQYNRFDKKFFSDSTRKFGFTVNGGADLYLGKEEQVVTTKYTYPVFVLLHAYAGIAWKPVQPLYFTLTGGPAVGLYNGTTRFNLGAQVSGQYILSEKICLGPALQFMKENGSDALWVASIGMNYHF